MPDTVRILGLSFYNGSIEGAIQLSLQGGLILAPSGPGLCKLDQGGLYVEALEQADINLIDSGYLAISWLLFKHRKLKRISGLRYIEALLNEPDFRDSDSHYWVMPDAVKSAKICQELTNRGITLNPKDAYIAPHYKSGGPIEDEILLSNIRKAKPRYIIINIAGDKQELLGAWLKKELDYRPSIICTGAAIAFICGCQVRIPVWADRLFLGWLFRIFERPQYYIKRYWAALRLSSLVKRFGEEKPVYAKQKER